MIFLLDSLRFFPAMLVNGIRSAARGNNMGFMVKGSWLVVHG